MKNNENNIPIWEKYALSIEEAAEYFGVGENRLRDLIKEQQDANFFLWIGNRTKIKRRLFENYLDQVNVI